MRPGFDDEALFKKLVRLMEDQKLYLDKDISRDALAREAATNRTYLSQVLSRRGLNYPGFVNSFRTQRAIELIWQESASGLPLADIAELSGFASVDVMNRYLKKCAGVTACAMRKRALGKN